MRNFFYRLSNAMARFMYGRNGSDQLNMALLAAYLLIWLLQALFGQSFAVRTALEVLAAVVAVIVVYRTFSRNLEKRREENARFLGWWLPVKNRISTARQQGKDKDHKYFICKNCKAVCRVPAGKGKVEITCPKCGGKIIGKS